MIISLIGMSGTGKTYWSKKLVQYGFTHICCDDLIENKLATELKKLGYKGIKGVAKWVGQPYEVQFKKRQKKYLKSEKQVMQDIMSKVKKGRIRNVVIDTSGSVVYAGYNIRNKLKKYTTIVYFKVPKSLYHDMFKRYMKEPKPLMWMNGFRKHNGEANEVALKRCYLKLLQHRAQLYKEYADITMDYTSLQLSNFTVDNFIKQVSLKS